MLGHGKINFETPNVIDPGDMPPSRPARVIQQEDDSVVLLRSEKPRRTKPALSRSIKLDYSMPADDEPQMDQEIGRSSSITSDQSDSTASAPPPDMDQARLFAATLLSETERRESSRNLMGNSSAPMRWPRRGRREEFQGLRTAVGMDDDRDGILKMRRMKRDRLCVWFAYLVVAFCSILAFATIARSVKGKSSPSTTTSARLSAAVDILSKAGVSSQEQFEDTSSPQYQAAHWIANVDSEQVGIPTDLGSQFQFLQRYALAVLYYAVGGSKWTHSLDFVSDAHECSWFQEVPDETGELYAVGVTCNNQLQVTNLLLPSNNLHGQVPSELSELSQLDFLSLKHNDLTGTIPHSFRRLSLLDYLDLKYNQFTGTIPHYLGDLPLLQVLGLSKNQLHGKIPGTFGALRLKTLALDENLLTGDLAPVSLLTTLEYLYLENNQFDANLDGLLQEMSNLVEVDLGGNEIESESIPAYLFTLPRLRTIDLHNNQVAGGFPEAIPENDVLEYFSIRENNIESTIPETISNLRALTHLDLESNALSGTIPGDALAQLSDLTYLFLGKNPMDEAIFPHTLHSLTSLRELSLDALQLRGTVPVSLEHLTDLKLLDLRMNQLSGSVDVDFSKLPGLTYLMLSSNMFTGAVPTGLDSLSDMQVLALHHNGFLGQAGGLCSPESELELLTTDCGAIECECCEECCDSDDCYNDVLWDVLEHYQGDWEESYRRSHYSFNPHILYGSDSRGGN